MKASFLSWPTNIATFLFVICVQYGNLSAQRFSEYFPDRKMDSAELNAIYGNPLIVRGILTVDGETALKFATRASGKRDVGFISAKLEISKILYASPEILKSGDLVSVDEMEANNVLLIDCPVLASRATGGATWIVDLERIKNSNVLVITYSPLLGGFYIDPLHQADETQIFGWIVKRININKKWNIESLERLLQEQKSGIMTP